MKRPQIHSYLHQWRTSILTLSICSLLLFFSFSLLHTKPATSNSHSPLPKAPKFAYLISGSKGGSPQMRRLLNALYHKRNFYLLHLDLDASEEERLEIAKYVKWVGLSGNVMVVGKADLVTYKGPTAVAAVVHAVAILLKQAEGWDWFVNLCAQDYPLFSQDDLLHIFSYLPRDLNFIEHSSDLGWKENQRARPIIIDPGLYHAKKSGVFWAKEKRSLPYSFKLFSGSEWVMLTRSFLDFCVWGWDNLPRTMLMYYTNFLSSSEGYFHTVICNDRNFQNTTVNHDLRYMKWDTPKQQPMNLTLEHFNEMVLSGAPFAHRFAADDPVLDKIDKELLRRPSGRLIYANPDAIKPSLHSKRLEKLMVQLLDPENFRSKQCK